METKIGSKNRRVREIWDKIAVFDWGEEMAFGSSYRQARKTEGNRDSSEFLGYYSLEFIISIRVPRSQPF